MKKEENQEIYYIYVIDTSDNDYKEKTIAILYNKEDAEEFVKYKKEKLRTNYIHTKIFASEEEKTEYEEMKQKKEKNAEKIAKYVYSQLENNKKLKEIFKEIKKSNSEIIFQKAIKSKVLYRYEMMESEEEISWITLDIYYAILAIKAFSETIKKENLNREEIEDIIEDEIEFLIKKYIKENKIFEEEPENS